MPKGQDSQNTSTLNGFNYLPARLHEYDKDDWQIEYYIQNPVTNRLERKRIRVNKILKQYKNRRNARAHIDSIIFSINSKRYSPLRENVLSLCLFVPSFVGSNRHSLYLFCFLKEVGMKMKKRRTF
ncbi:MAG: hypothetical protein WCU80_03495 [Paludibacteraceae bacterium]|nr:hypothetical protein [Prevotellaceae bacterium]